LSVPTTFLFKTYSIFDFRLLYRYELNKFETADHGGTHVDAPSHFAEGKLRMHEIPMEKLIGPGVIIDVKVNIFFPFILKIKV
jgi:kynurenine formamidase